VAAHWRYKYLSYGFDAEAAEASGGRDPMNNLRQLVQVLENGGDAEELVEHAKLEMFLDQVFVFTPKGKLISLPTGAMPLDFAYALHTDIGDTTVGAKVNGELRPLRTALQNGDVVQIVRGPQPTVWPEWSSLTITGRARSAIRRHIRQSEREELARIGRASIDEIFARAGKSRSEVSLRPALERFGAQSDEELFIAVGRGRAPADQVLETVFPGLKADERDAASARRRIQDGPDARMFVRGVKLGSGARLHFAECCTPAPGDRIVGIVEGDGRVTVHAIDCANLAQYEDREDMWRDLHWTALAEQGTLSIVRLTVTIRNTPGVLGQVCTIVGEAGGNIVNLSMRRRQADFFDADFEIEVRDARHLTLIAAALRACPSVEEADRAKG
jgi:GTP pyrophosphokinase/guanosine-3',5'-bis(diphosphate) 3'-pyrophosphohydrolase